MIYGREKARYTYSYTDSNSATIDQTFDWELDDTLLDNSDNTTIINSELKLFKPEKIYESRGTKNVKVTFKFNDGWNNTYHHTYNENFVATPYTKPDVSLIYTPDPFHINEQFIIDPIYNDSGTKGEIRTNLDLNLGDLTLKSIQKDDTTSHTYSRKDSFVIRADFKYWDGWELQDHYITDSIEVANTPPISDYNYIDSGICVTKRIWSDDSSDLDGQEDIVDRRFYLKQETSEGSNTFASISSKVLANKDDVFEYQFAREGTYQIQYTITDADGVSDTKEDIFDIEFQVCDGTVNTGTNLSGTIALQLGWQLICVPVTYGYWDNGIVKDTTPATISNYVIKQLCQKTNKTQNELKQYVDVCNAFRGASDAQNFVVGLTAETSENNFKLSYVDGDSTEFTAFWINVLQPVPDIEWEYYDGK